MRIVRSVSMLGGLIVTGVIVLSFVALPPLRADNVHHTVVHGDAVLLSQAVLALCRNAREAMPKGGPLSITARIARNEDFDRLPTSPAEPFAHFTWSERAGERTVGGCDCFPARSSS